MVGATEQEHSESAPSALVPTAVASARSEIGKMVGTRFGVAKPVKKVSTTRYVRPAKMVWACLQRKTSVVAKRSWWKGPSLLDSQMEVWSVTDALANSNIETATMALSPQNASLNFKFLINCVALGGVEEHDAGSGLFVNFSRVNHDCVGNSSHYFDPELGLKLLVANHDIPAGSEVTFSYVSDADSSSGRAERLNFRGFKCTCAACQTPEIAAKLDRMIELDRKIMILGSHGKSEAAIRAGTALIKLYDELQCSDMLYARTYYDLFQVAIPKSRTMQQGHGFIKKAYEHGLLFYGREAHEAVRQYKKYAEQPSLHRNYRCID